MNSLGDWRLEWDAFWSKVHAGASLEHLHNARFAKLHEIHHLLKTHPGKPSHILGLDSLYGRPIRVQATKTKPEIGNVLDIGSTRCGKSRREIAQLLSWPGSAVVNDIKGELFKATDFSAKDLLFSGQPITVYFCWPESELHALTPLIRLIWEALLNDLIATYDSSGGVGCHPILLSLDEAGRTGLQNLPEYTATVNGRGISISMSAQSFEQFKSLYGENRAKTLLNNMDTQIYHRQASFDTAKSLEGWLGYKSGWATSQSKHGDRESEAKSEREIPLLTARQIAQLPDEEIIILHRNIPPIQARRMDLNRVPRLAQMSLLPPPPVYRIGPPFKPLLMPRWRRKYLNHGAYLMPMGTLGLPATLDELRRERE